MKRASLLIVAIALMPPLASAAYIGGMEITGIYGSSTISVGVAAPPADTCDYFGYHFKFDATTDAGRNMLSMLLSAQLAGKTIQVWYTPSSSPGTDYSGGCDSATMAVVTHIGIRN